MSRDVQTIAMDLELVNWKLAHAFAQDSKELIVVSVTNYDYIQGNILTSKNQLQNFVKVAFDT